VNFFQSSPFRILALVLTWRVLLLVFTVQPIPANDAFGYDGAVVNFLDGGRYVNPSFSVIFPISGRELYATYPPLYQGVLLLWMKLFGTTVVSAMVLHLGLFAISAVLTLGIVRQFLPNLAGYAVVALLFFGFTFVDRPESLAYVFGLGALWLVTRQLSQDRFRTGLAAALALALLLGLYTSVIVGAFFYGVGFVACTIAFLWRRNPAWFAPFIVAAILFAAITLAIAKWEPLWWAGFLESAGQQSVVTKGLHLPPADSIVKLVRTAPVFLLGVALLPALVGRRREIISLQAPWLAVVGGIFIMGWLMLAAAVMLLSPNYVSYVMFTQVILAAGLVALVQQFFPAHARWARVSLAACVVLVSIRAIGMTTWGAACAWKNSYHDTQAVLRAELTPYTTSEEPVFVSSAFLYSAVNLGVKNPVHSDWYFNHATWTNGVQLCGLEQCRPSKLILTQFDYYRSFKPLVEQLGSESGLVEVRVRNLAAVPPPDAFPSVQRVVQHVSWAPVIVDLNWKPPPSR
jgi:hypothetical protein